MKRKHSRNPARAKVWWVITVNRPHLPTRFVRRVEKLPHGFRLILTENWQLAHRWSLRAAETFSSRLIRLAPRNAPGARFYVDRMP